ncbi:resistance protein [Aspergillus sclerotialis]|uniref:Resistance protein n=1 Tax=Aspergillus sclerotialis TaxID=2070753 RepID=A0A3A2ZM08_9EURO|nr:resistance protein [Aspergillus sclerotialis]
MDSPFKTTIFGQLMRSLSGNRLYSYPDEVDPSLWKKAVKQDSSSTSPSLNEQTDHVSKEAGAQDAAGHGTIFEGHSVLLVGWYGPDDPENPQNYPFLWKSVISFQMCILNFAVYIASSIYVPGEPGIMEEFNVSETVATLGLSLFTM